MATGTTEQPEMNSYMEKVLLYFKEDMSTRCINWHTKIYFYFFLSLKGNLNVVSVFIVQVSSRSCRRWCCGQQRSAVAVCLATNLTEESCCISPFKEAMKSDIFPGFVFYYFKVWKQTSWPYAAKIYCFIFSGPPSNKSRSVKIGCLRSDCQVKTRECGDRESCEYTLK